MSKTLPKELTSYDLLKTFAIVLMLVDHIGFYFFFTEDASWWRVYGRLCVPVWFFLIGYANSRDLGKGMWIGCGLVIMAHVTAGLTLFPINILASMILIRLVLDNVMQRALRSNQTFWAFNAVLFFLIIPSGIFFEYGTGGLILAMLGWFYRRKEEFKDRKDLIHNYTAFALVSYVIVQFMVFAMDQQEVMVLSIGCLIVITVLYLFRPMTFPRLTKVLPFPLVWLLKLTGRRSLEIYVGHILILDAYGLYKWPHRFSLFDWEFFYF